MGTLAEHRWTFSRAGRTCFLAALAFALVSVNTALLAANWFRIAGPYECTDASTRRRLDHVLARQGVREAGYAAIRQIARQDDEVRCSAILLTRDGRTHDMTYRIANPGTFYTGFQVEWRTR
jgi:hypothetical protein